jgi:hypothetical protein
MVNPHTNLTGKSLSSALAELPVNSNLFTQRSRMAWTLSGEIILTLPRFFWVLGFKAIPSPWQILHVPCQGVPLLTALA